MEKVRNVHWVKCQVQDVAELFRGITYKKEMVSKIPKHGYKLILRANNIKDGKINFDELLYVPIGLIKNEQIICKGDIVFSMSSGSKHLVGKSAQTKDSIDGSFGAFCGLLRPSEHINDKYISYIFQDGEYRKLISEIAKGSNINNLKREHILEYYFWLPPIEEQRRVVEKIEELFSELDKGIESLKTARERLKLYRQALLKHAFEGKLTEQWRKDNADKLEPADLLLFRIQQEREIRYLQQVEKWNKEIKKREADGKERKKPAKPRKFVEPDLILQEKLDELAVLPKNWKWCKVGHVFDVYVGSTPSRKKPDYWNGDIHWVSSGEVAFCHINETDEKITEEGCANTSTQIHPIGTVMLAMIGEGKTRGQVAILNVEAAHNQNTAAIRVSETDCNTLLFYYYLLFQYELTRKLGSGNNQKALSKDRVSNMLFPLLPIDEQVVIAARVDEINSVIEKTDIEIFENLSRAEALRQSILKKAFTGQLVPQDPADESASALLERIKAEKEKLKKIIPKKKKTARRKNAA